MESIIFLVFGLALSTFCIWGVVRIAKRRKKKKARFWATVAMAVILYAFSIGPAKWALKKAHAPEPVELVAAVIYFPVIVAGNLGPRATRNLYVRYVSLWGS